MVPRSPIVSFIPLRDGIQSIVLVSELVLLLGLQVLFRIPRAQNGAWDMTLNSFYGLVYSYIYCI